MISLMLCFKVLCSEPFEVVQPLEYILFPSVLVLFTPLKQIYKVQFLMMTNNRVEMELHLKQPPRTESRHILLK